MERSAKRILSVTALLLTLTVIFTVSVWGATPFQDVRDGDWFASSVEYVYEKELMNGVSGDLFEPNGTMTRAMLVTVLGRMAGVSDGEYSNSGFSDVEEGKWFSPYVAWAAEKGVVNGMPDGTFHPEDNVTRQDAACMIARYLRAEGLAPEYSGKSDFPDGDDIASYALDSVELMAAMGLIRGDNHGLFHPTNQITRAEAATILMRLDEKLTETEEPSEDPSEEPSEDPSEEPSEDPSEEPSEDPSEEPSEDPSEEPSEDPSEEPEEPPFIDVTDTDADGDGWASLIR